MRAYLLFAAASESVGSFVYADVVVFGRFTHTSKSLIFNIPKMSLSKTLLSQRIVSVWIKPSVSPVMKLHQSNITTQVYYT
jgi:hypothetical protein